MYLDSRDATRLINRWLAELAQLVERRLAKAKVAGSNPVFRSNEMGPGVADLESAAGPSLFGFTPAGTYWAHGPELRAAATRSR